jgi:hypothetical protein
MWCLVRGALNVVRSSWAANTSAARRQVRAGCADRVSRKEAKTQRRQGWGNTVTELVVRPFKWCLQRGAVLLGRKHERSEASSARELRGQSLTQRSKDAKRAGMGNCCCRIVVPSTWCLQRGAVLLGRKDERSEASSARGMRGQSLTQRSKDAKKTGMGNCCCRIVVPSTWCGPPGPQTRAQRGVKCTRDARTESHAKKRRRKEVREGRIVAAGSWCLLRGAVLLGRKDERSEASSARELRGQRPRRTAPR